MKNLNLVIKQCFNDMYVVARFYAEKDFTKREQRGEKYKVARALVFLKDVANNPDKYFSFESTNDAWESRVDDYIATSGLSEKQIKEYGVGYVRSLVKGSLAWGPADIVFDKIHVLFLGTRCDGLYDFCQYVQSFYYKPYYKDLYVNERMITEYANKMAGLAKIAKQKNPVLRTFMQICNKDYER